MRGNRHNATQILMEMSTLEILIVAGIALGAILLISAYGRHRPYHRAAWQLEALHSESRERLNDACNTIDDRWRASIAAAAQSVRSVDNSKRRAELLHELDVKLMEGSERISQREFEAVQELNTAYRESLAQLRRAIHADTPDRDTLVLAVIEDARRRQSDLVDEACARLRLEFGDPSG